MTYATSIIVLAATLVVCSALLAAASLQFDRSLRLCDSARRDRDEAAELLAAVKRLAGCIEASVLESVTEGLSGKDGGE